MIPMEGNRSVHASRRGQMDPETRTGLFSTKELPSLSGAALSIIREAKALAEQEGEATLDEYPLLFGEL
jgi:hypothetical protein